MADIWQEAARASEAENLAEPGRESFVITLGSKQGGKSTLINSFLNPNKDDTPKPTVALEYTYGRKPVASGGVSGKDIAHIWELGGNSAAFAELVSIVVTPQRLPTNVLILVLDLSKPADAIATAVKWLGVVRSRVAECLDKVKAKGGPPAVEQLTTAAVARMRVGWAQRTGNAVSLIAGGSAAAAPAAAAAGGEADANGASPRTGEGGAAGNAPVVTLSAQLTQPALVAHALATLPEHPDARVVAPTLLPMQVIVAATKWDALRDEDAPKRKAVQAALRYIALVHGAHLVVTSTRDKATLSLFRSLLNATVFLTDARKGAVIDSSKPLVIPAGADCLDAIGAPLQPAGAKLPAVSKADLEVGPVEARIDKYGAVVRAFFPPAPGAPDADDDALDPSKVPPAPNAIVPGTTVVFNDEASRFAEPVIDMLRASKAEELGRYVREQERRLRLEAKAAMGPGAGEPAGAASAAAASGAARRPAAAGAAAPAAAAGRR